MRLKVPQATQTKVTPWSATGVPGKSWQKSFKQRHPKLVNRKNQPLKLARAKGLCPSATASFYCNLKELHDTWNYPPSNIWNCDESGVQAGRSGGGHCTSQSGETNLYRQLNHITENTYRFRHASILMMEKFKFKYHQGNLLSTRLCQKL